MAYNRENKNYVVNEELIASYLEDLVKQVEGCSEEELKTLTQLKKLFKKNVSLTRRNYVAALLLRNATQNFKGSRFNRDKSEKFEKKFTKNEKFQRNERTEKSERMDKSERTERTETSERPERHPRVTIDPSMAETIFVSVGRGRGVFPRDLVGLLVSVAGFDRNRIGEIRVLSNYSFIQLFKEDCDKAISALNDYEYRGRKLSVSYSSKKEDKTAETAPVQESKPETAEIAEETVPQNVSNESHGISETTETAKIAAEQTAFAAEMTKTEEAQPVAPYSETTDDGQVKSHFGDGAAY